MLKHSPRRRTCHWRKLDILRCTSRCRPLPDRLESEAEEPRPCHRRSCRQRRSDSLTHSNVSSHQHADTTDLSALMYCEGMGLQRTPATWTWAISFTWRPRFSPSIVTRVPPSRGPVTGLICGGGAQQINPFLEITWHLFLDLLQLPLTVCPCFLVVSISYI